jgi:hypothetical protein
MSPCAERRAAEREALKLARKANASTVNQQNELPAASNTAAELPAVFMAAAGASEPLSDARLAANRANAALSTGPTSPEGKAKSSLNAVKTGLTGRTVLLSTDDAAVYQQHLDRHITQYQPATDEEKALVQAIGDTEWRLLRIAPLEAGIYAIGRRQLADQFADEPDATNREALIHAQIFVTYRKDLSNLALQERRLRNQLTADTAKLETMQKERHDKRQRDFGSAKVWYTMAQKRQIPFDPAFFGFVFSTDELDDQMVHEEAKKFVIGPNSELNQEQFDAYVTKWKERKAA